MVRAVVIGGGVAGMATAARLAKLGHQVTLLERSPTLGGALKAVTDSGFTWHDGPATILLPAVLRDLFRKSGRPLERELALHPVPVIREHRFPDGSAVRLPGGSRAAQLRAVDSLGTGSGAEWVRFVATLADDWELARRHYLEVPWDRATADPAAVRLLESRRSLQSRLRRDLSDPRLRALAAQPARALGGDPRSAPGWWAVWPYVEQRFGGWLPEGGMPALATALADRLAVRRVEVHLATPALDVILRGGRPVGVRTAAGDLDADVVVCAVEPCGIPALAGYDYGGAGRGPGWTTRLGLVAADEDDVPERVHHGADDLTVQVGGPASGAAPAGSVAWTVRSTRPGDPLTRLAAAVVDVRDRVLVRHDPVPTEPVGSGRTVGAGRRSRRRELGAWGPRTPVPGLYAAGAHAAPGPGLPSVGLSAALVAQVIGPA